MFASTRTESKWRLRGAPYCEHPTWRADRGPAGRDEVDEYCMTCGVTRFQNSDEDVPPRGNR